MMTTAALYSVPVPTSNMRFSSFPLSSTTTLSSHSPPLNPVTFSVKYPYKFLCHSSLTEEEEEGTSSPDLLQFSPQDSGTLPNPLGGCQACGKQEIERGCNGEGRIQGGIATVPGFGWWPIKAYRPCPGFVASGGRYRRQGQSMDEVAFGRGPPVETEIIIEDKESKKKKKKKKSPKGSTST